MRDDIAAPFVLFFVVVVTLPHYVYTWRIITTLSMHNCEVV